MSSSNLVWITSSFNYSATSGIGDHHPLDVDRCKALKYHERGHWHHTFPNNVFATDEIYPNLRNMYYTPLELGWVAGRSEMPADGGCSQYKHNQGLSYTSGLGNQCGCLVKGFKPSHSVWTLVGNNNHTTNGTTDLITPVYHQEDVKYAFISSPSLQLIQRLAKAGRNLCFFGDSIDKQF